MPDEDEGQKTQPRIVAAVVGSSQTPTATAPSATSITSWKKAATATAEDGDSTTTEGSDADRSKLELETEFAGLEVEEETGELEEDEEERASTSRDRIIKTPPPGGSYHGSLGGSLGGGSGGGELDVEKTVECTEVIVPIQTLAQKCLFYITGFFVLLAIISLFIFLFLVPFVIDPAFSSIFMEFDPEPATCLTISNVQKQGSSNCNWTSCREGCTRETFQCTQVRVNYRKSAASKAADLAEAALLTTPPPLPNSKTKPARTKPHPKHTKLGGGQESPGDPLWDYKGAHLFPNVKGCGYPPVVVCSSWYATYGEVGSNFSCYYSKVDRGLVVTSFDMSKVIMDLVYSMAIPIPSFIISVVYLIFAYFRIYNGGGSGDSAAAAAAAAARRPGGVVATSSTNNNIGGGGGGDESLSLGDNSAASEKTKLNSNKLVGNSTGGVVLEMNDLGAKGEEGQLPRRNNRAPPPERNGPSNPGSNHAKNKGDGGSECGSVGSGRKYLEPGVLPERKVNLLPPIQLPSTSSQPPSISPEHRPKDWKNVRRGKNWGEC